MRHNIIKAIFLDADNTLVDHSECERQALVYLFEHIGIAYQESYRAAFNALDRELWSTNMHQGRMVTEEQIPTYRFQVLFDMFQIPYSDYKRADELWCEGFAASVALMPKAEEAVAALHQAGFKLCVVTTGTSRLYLSYSSGIL